MPLREALLKAYDLKSIKVELLKMFQIQASDKNEITRLSKLFSKGKVILIFPYNQLVTDSFCRAW